MSLFCAWSSENPYLPGRSNDFPASYHCLQVVAGLWKSLTEGPPFDIALRETFIYQVQVRWCIHGCLTRWQLCVP